jgi:hypothetical protein
MTCLPHNRVMQNLARKFCIDFCFESGDCDGRLAMAAPTPISWWSEAIAGSTSFTTIVFDLQTRLFSMAPAGPGH